MADVPPSAVEAAIADDQISGSLRGPLRSGVGKLGTTVMLLACTAPVVLLVQHIHAAVPSRVSLRNTRMTEAFEIA